MSCWGNGLGAPPEVSVLSVSLGHRHACAFTESQEVVCWGENEDGQSTVPEGLYSEVTAGGDHSCVILLNDTLDLLGQR